MSDTASRERVELHDLRMRVARLESRIVPELQRSVERERRGREKAERSAAMWHARWLAERVARIPNKDAA